MPKWERNRKNYLVKRAKIADGEFLHLLRKVDGPTPKELAGPYYEALKGLKASGSKILLWVVASGAFAVLSHFHVLKGASASGLDVSPSVFSHAALIALSFSSASYCFVFCKQTYIRSWFDWLFKKGDPADRADLLMRYPDAYWHFSYLPAHVGYPLYINADRTLIFQLLYIILILIGLAIFSLGSISLWTLVALDVLRSREINHIVSILTVSISTIAAVLGWTSPFYHNITRKYTHNGLVSELNKRQGTQLEAAHLRVYRAALSMGLAKQRN